MATFGVLGSQSRAWINFDRTWHNSIDSLQVSWNYFESRNPLKRSFLNSRSRGVALESRPLEVKILCSYKNTSPPPGTKTKSPLTIDLEESFSSLDEDLVLKKKAQELEQYLDGRCIYLIGMMGSGKTTVGKILSEALGYSFVDSDELVEVAVGGIPVSQIFKEHSETFFRDHESKVLQKLSSEHQLLVATGGGVVIRPINWRYMKQGIVVWLDVPLEALARRIASVGTDSRPLLHQESGDAYMKAFAQLTTLFEERGEAYANANTRVCLQHIAAKHGHGDVSALTPTAIAIEVLIQIENFIINSSRGNDALV